MRTQHRRLEFLPAIIALLLAFPFVSIADAAPGGKGKPGGGSGDGSTQILPQSLGTSPDCALSSGTGINTNVGFGLYVSAHGTNCTPPIVVAALRWSQGLGMQNIGTLPGSNGANAMDVSDDGTVVGGTGGSVALPFVFPPGAAAVAALPMLAGMTFGNAEGISPDSRFISGTNSTDQVLRAVRWTQINGGWVVSALDVSGVVLLQSAPAVSNDGTVLVNRQTTSGSTRIGHAGYWTAGSAQWTELPGFDTLAHSISATGDWIVGQRLAPCTSGCNRFPVPVYWKKNVSGWSGPFDLPALDGADSTAHAIAERNGRRIIVGHGFTRKDAIQRAVYWLEQPDGSFTLNRLAALGGRSKAWATAEDVNNAGQIVGASAGSGLTKFAVMWTLP